MRTILCDIFGERFLGFILGIALIELIVLTTVLLIWLIHEFITDFETRPFNHSRPKK